MFLISNSFRNSITSISIKKLHIFELNHLFSSQSIKSLKSAKEGSFTVNYFISNFGFSPEKAISASNYVNFKNTDKPDALIAFLKNQGFSETQVSKLVRTHPRIVLYDPEKHLLPKLEYFRSQGVSEADLSLLLSKAPNIFNMNLNKRVIPSFNRLKKLLGSAEEAIRPIIVWPQMFSYLERHVIPNIDILRKAGVPESIIKTYFILWPRALCRDPNKINQDVEEVIKLGIDPLKSTFLIAVVVMGHSKLVWNKKIKIYKRWGCSKDEVLEAFVINPWCMGLSEDKVNKIFGFFVNEMGWTGSRLMHNSKILSYSLTRRIIPRCSVYRALISKGLIKEDFRVYTLLNATEEKFRTRYVERYEKEAPELLKLYQEKLKLSTNHC